MLSCAQGLAGAKPGQGSCYGQNEEDRCVEKSRQGPCIEELGVTVYFLLCIDEGFSAEKLHH